MAFEPILVTRTVDEATAEMLGDMREALDGWSAVEGSVEVAIVETEAAQLVPLEQQVVDGTDTAVAGFATTMGFPPFEAVAAHLPSVTLDLLLPASAGDGTADVDVPVVIASGFTIQTVDQQYATTAEFADTVTFSVIDSGPNEGLYGASVEVSMTAVVPGSAGNVAAGTPTSIVTSSGLVIAATIAADGIGGTDAESLPAFLSRFAVFAQTLGQSTVRAEQSAKVASTLSGVQRALGVDLYDPADPDTEAARTTTIFLLDADGAPVSAGIKAAVLAYLNTLREVNYQFFVEDPNYNALAVVVELTKTAEADSTTVHDAVVDAITAYLDPAAWGTVAGDPTTWTERAAISAFDLGAVIAAVDGVASVTSVTINGSDGVTTLDGPAALPDAVGSGSTTAVTVS